MLTARWPLLNVMPPSTGHGHGPPVLRIAGIGHRCRHGSLHGHSPRDPCQHPRRHVAGGVSGDGGGGVRHRPRGGCRDNRLRMCDLGIRRPLVRGLRPLRLHRRSRFGGCRVRPTRTQAAPRGEGHGRGPCGRHREPGGGIVCDPAVHTPAAHPVGRGGGRPGGVHTRRAAGVLRGPAGQRVPQGMRDVGDRRVPPVRCPGLRVHGAPDRFGRPVRGGVSPAPAPLRPVRDPGPPVVLEGWAHPLSEG